MIKRSRKYPERLQYDQLVEQLGVPGKMLSSHKSNPAGRESHTIYWNACVFDRDGTQVWWGDLDITEVVPKLQALAERVGPIYLTPEHPWRFDGFEAGMKYGRDRLVTVEPK